MAVVKKKNSSNQWEVYTDTLKTDITVTHLEEPTTIVAGDVPYLVSSQKIFGATGSSYVATGIKITIQRAGTYNFKIGVCQEEENGTVKTVLRQNGTNISSELSLDDEYQELSASNISCSVGDVIELYMKGAAYSTKYSGYAGPLVAYIQWE